MKTKVIFLILFLVAVGQLLMTVRDVAKSFNDRIVKVGRY